jgi:hypothetical protein
MAQKFYLGSKFLVGKFRKGEGTLWVLGGEFI